MPLSRRAFLVLSATLPWARGAAAQASGAIHVRKDPNCECCTGWVEHLRTAGFEVTVEEMHAGLLVAFKAERGIPVALQSCHTGEVEGYLLEGHVPAADVRRLLAERPAALGLAVPGMPYGSPGMGPESERDAYEVTLFRSDGSSDVWSAYEAA